MGPDFFITFLREKNTYHNKKIFYFCKFGTGFVYSKIKCFINHKIY